MDSELQIKYDLLTKNQLKVELKRLKAQKSSDDTPKIRYVAKLLRFKVASPSTLDKNKVSSIDHDREILNGFSGYCKEFLEKANRITPSFTCDIIIITLFILN